MLTRIDWQALQEAQTVASKPIQLEFSFEYLIQPNDDFGNERAR